MWACPSGRDDDEDGDRGEARDGYTTFVAGLRGSAHQVIIIIITLVVRNVDSGICM